MKNLAVSLATLVALSLSVPALAQQKESDEKIAGRVVSQPARDVGIAKTKIPPVLQRAADATYAPVSGCARIAAGISELSEALGPDFGSGESSKRAGIAELGGSAVVNSLIPFRGVVREVSGAAGAQRRLEQAISAGHARRGYLRGLQSARGCRR
ncbi:hypothetical protein [Sphingomonas hylomeconis]|uniref:Uncharacterized protein n=1 Tax=Sphingomonas hylomeconis TaxID=1395958 RepID=A0ABV7SY48_9SPHN|nr:hypothetical protein [Sphingomonas hylomeconis]